MISPVEIQLRQSWILSGHFSIRKQANHVTPPRLKAFRMDSTWEFRVTSSWRRSRERHSPEWRDATRPSGDWRTRISIPSAQINFGIQVEYTRTETRTI